MMRKIQAVTLSFTVLALFAFILVLLFPAAGQAESAVKNAKGKVTMLRVHEVGSKYGGASDEVDVEVIFKLDSVSDMAFGFKLRDDKNLAVHQGMLDLLRDAFANGWIVYTDYIVADVEFPKKNVEVFRLWITKN